MTEGIRDSVPGLTGSERDWAVQKARAVGLATARNVRSSLGLPCAIPSGERRTPRAGTFVVVGAGPSLDRTGKYLASMQDAGALIVTTNTGCPAVLRHGVMPNVVVAREVLTVGPQLAGLEASCVRVLDLGCSPEMFERQAAIGPTAWFVQATVACFELASILGVRPLYGGDASLTAAVALADAWGAEEVVLLGVDLAFADDGSAYGAGTAYEGERATLEGGYARLDGRGHERRRAVADAAGLERPSERVRWMTVGAYGGELVEEGGRRVPRQVRTQGTWVSQIEWLMQRAGRDPSLRCIDATGEGAAKPAWYEASAESVVADLRSRGAKRPRLPMEDVPAGRVQAAVEWFERQATDAQVVAATTTDPLGVPVACPGLWDLDLVSLVASAGQIRAIETPGTILDKIRGVYGALGAAGVALAETLAADPAEGTEGNVAPAEPRGNEMPDLAEVGPADPNRDVSPREDAGTRRPRCSEPGCPEPGVQWGRCWTHAEEHSP